MRTNRFFVFFFSSIMFLVLNFFLLKLVCYFETIFKLFFFTTATSFIEEFTDMYISQNTQIEFYDYKILLYMDFSTLSHRLTKQIIVNFTAINGGFLHLLTAATGEWV